MPQKHAVHLLAKVLIRGRAYVGCVPKEVAFPDPLLGAAIREAVDKLEGPSYTFEMEGPISFNATERHVTDLTGMEYCVNLTELWLGGLTI